MRVAAVIPAYNEETTIGEVVNTLRRVDLIDDIVVVSDGSHDRTAEVARQAGARVIEHKENLGKAGAMKTGFMNTQGSYILFLDADLIGLSPAHVRSLLSPVLAGEADMTVGVFDDGRVATDLAQLVAPYLSGQRAVRREIVEEMFIEAPDADVCRFGIEVALTRHVKHRGYKAAEVSLEEMSHRMKEEKLGLVKGMAARVKMYYEILKYAQRG
ncbi:MAG TPA: glycosyltransferase family 2 protein [Symbiobacteriaceae bacterium]|jgi:glycosyltransferase involved in cell wall biosynthesis|nr:glycosyltransferase family 2 protein [Symbiobacteriaceae bacterium]